MCCAKSAPPSHAHHIRKQRPAPAQENFKSTKKSQKISEFELLINESFNN